MQHEHSSPQGGNRQRTIFRLVFVGFAGIAAYFLITEHRAHLFGILPFLLLAACPLLHVFHHRGHKQNDSTGPGESTGSQSGPGANAHRH